MGSSQRRKKTHHAHKGNVGTRKEFATKHRTRDFDQVHEDFNTESKREALENQPVDPDLPGSAQFYCVPCARYFINAETLKKHTLSGPHKAMMRRLQKDRPWTTEDAKIIKTDNGKPLGRKPVIVPLDAPEGAGAAPAGPMAF
eukprot:m51a1_g5943 putative zinc finger (143) ;mRNA; f:121291-121820